MLERTTKIERHSASTHHEALLLAQALINENDTLKILGYIPEEGRLEVEYNIELGEESNSEK